MLNQVHQHITEELQQGARTDTVFVVTAVLFNLVVLAVNSGVAGGAANSDNTVGPDITLVIFFIMTVLVNVVAVNALNAGRSTRDKLLNGLIAMYKDNEVDQYYDPSLLNNYKRRYQSFTVVVVSLAFVAVAVPLVIRFTGG